MSPGTVLFYLIRMEPFTAMNRNLQGGRFDHADRLFCNVAATWDNCLHSSSDVKELTPEFFHQSEFLLNSNNFNLGTQQVVVVTGFAQQQQLQFGHSEGSHECIAYRVFSLCILTVLSVFHTVVQFHSACRHCEISWTLSSQYRVCL